MLKEIKNCRVISGEDVVTQHRVVVMAWQIKTVKNSRPAQVSLKMKWCMLRKGSLKKVLSVPLSFQIFLS